MKKIVYLHGYNSSGKIFNYLISKLPEHESIVVEYNSSDPVEDSMAVALKKIPKSEPFYIVSHSLGGILAHHIASIYDVPIEGLVSISTPYGGSDTASKLKWFYPKIKVFRDLTPSSNCIRNLNTNKLPCSFLSIISTAGGLPFMSEANDGVVTVASQKAIKSTKKVEVKSNHFEAVQDPVSLREITKFIFKDTTG